MNAEELELEYGNGYICQGAGYLRFILMAFVCFWSFGFPEPTGVLSAISGFAVPAFFILSGYFVLVENRQIRIQKTEQKIKKTLKWFVCIFACYLILNLVLRLMGYASFSLSLRTVFNFIVLNMWPLPICSNFWFIQALLYAYIVIYIADKMNLLKYYKVALVTFIVLMLLFGEFAGLIHFNVRGYTYIPGNWITRALPYLLIGMLMREKTAFLLKQQTRKYVLVILLGRNGLLVYGGHMIGYGIMAIAICGCAFIHHDLKPSIITYFDTDISCYVYAFMEPVYYVMGLMLGRSNLGFMSFVGGEVACVISIVLALAILNSPLYPQQDI